MVGRYAGTILVDVRPVGVICQRHQGSTGGEREGNRRDWAGPEPAEKPTRRRAS
jgi:hypothetical protein